MFENITYEIILERMLGRVRAQNPHVDTREGSIIFSAIAPAAVELQNMYLLLDSVMDESFADTASRTYLIKRCAERGITPYPAVHAILQGEFNVDVPIGSRFSLDALDYVATERISFGIYRMRCETIGKEGNRNFGTLVPIDYVAGLETAMLTKLLIPGQDEEDTEHLRQRYFDNLNAQAFGGNIKDYQEKVSAIPGVGGVKVFPACFGGGTVRLVITASDHSCPSQTLVDTVQAQIDPVQSQGEGVGFAPVGHIVTVDGARGSTIDVAARLTLEEGWSEQDVLPNAIEAVDKYFYELSSEWEDNAYIVVRISQIETRLLNLPGVVDVANTTINAQEQNLPLGEDEIPVRGEISWIES